MLKSAALLAAAAACAAAADHSFYAEAEATFAQPHGAFRPYALSADPAGGSAGAATNDFGFSFAPRLALGARGERGRAELSVWWFRQTSSSSLAGNSISPVVQVDVSGSGNGTADATSTLRAVVVDLVGGPAPRVTADGAASGSAWSFDGACGLRYLDVTAAQDSGFDLSGNRIRQDDRTRTWGIGPVLAIQARWRIGGFGIGASGNASLLRAQAATDRRFTGVGAVLGQRDSEARVVSTIAYGPFIDWTWRSLTVTASYEFSRWSDVLDDRDYQTQLGAAPAPRDVRWDVISLGAGYTF